MKRLVVPGWLLQDPLWQHLSAVVPPAAHAQLRALQAQWREWACAQLITSDQLSRLAGHPHEYDEVTLHLPDLHLQLSEAGACQWRWSSSRSRPAREWIFTGQELSSAVREHWKGLTAWPSDDLIAPATELIDAALSPTGDPDTRSALRQWLDEIARRSAQWHQDQPEGCTPLELDDGDFDPQDDPEEFELVHLRPLRWTLQALSSATEDSLRATQNLSWQIWGELNWGGDGPDEHCLGPLLALQLEAVVGRWPTTTWTIQTEAQTLSTKGRHTSLREQRKLWNNRKDTNEAALQSAGWLAVILACGAHGDLSPDPHLLSCVRSLQCHEERRFSEWAWNQGDHPGTAQRRCQELASERSELNLRLHLQRAGAPAPEWARLFPCKEATAPQLWNAIWGEAEATAEVPA